MKAVVPMRVGAPVFGGLEPGADVPKCFARSEVMSAAEWLRRRGFVLLYQISNEGNRVAIRASPASLARFGFV